MPKGLRSGDNAGTLAVIPEEDDSFILESKTLREKLNVEVIKQLKYMAAASTGGANSMYPAVADMPASRPR